MKATAPIRRFDDLGRILIPREVRLRAFETANTEGKPMEIYCEDDGTIILKPYQPADCEEGDNDNQRI